MNNYDPNIPVIKYLESSKVGMTQYEFDTFVVGKHHSRARLIQDLLKRKSKAQDVVGSADLTKFGIDLPATIKTLEAKQLIEMIDSELAQHDINLLKDLESEEPAYWIDELARTSALEINTYGRIRPETMDKLMLLPEDHFVSAMNKSAILVVKLKNTAEGAQAIDAPIPENLPRT